MTPTDAPDVDLPPMDEPTVIHPVVRMVEREAIAMYRRKYSDGPVWQELANPTRGLWVAEAEKKLRSLPTWSSMCAAAIRGEKK